MPTATWNGTVLAQSEHCEIVEGNRYLRGSPTHTTCPWKGVASYYHVVVNGETNEDAAWYYPEPKEAARRIKDHVAFWRGVRVED